MIKAILIFNNHGKPRLIRFYQYFVSILGGAVKTLAFVFCYFHNPELKIKYM